MVFNKHIEEWRLVCLDTAADNSIMLKEVYMTL